MATTPSSATPASPPAPPPIRQPDKNEIIIYSHSNLFYWWPVWALGLLMAVLTAVEGHYMVVVHSTADLLVNVTGKGVDERLNKDGQKRNTDVKLVGREAIVLPEKDSKLYERDYRLSRVDATEGSAISDLRVHMTANRGYGVLFCIAVLLVIVITNVPLRGMWSILVIISIVTLSLVFHLVGWWDDILRRLSLLDIRINLGGYLFLSLVLFAIWLFTLLFFDRQIYMVFTPGQLKVCTEIGGGEKVYDAVGMAVEKQRSDIFRHWILGLGSGDLIVKTAGAQAHHFDLPNVLFISKKVQMIEDLLKKRSVVEAR